MMPNGQFLFFFIDVPIQSHNMNDAITTFGRRRLTDSDSPIAEVYRPIPLRNSVWKWMAVKTARIQFAIWNTCKCPSR